MIVWFGIALGLLIILAVIINAEINKVNTSILALYYGTYEYSSCFHNSYNI